MFREKIFHEKKDSEDIYIIEFEGDTTKRGKTDLLTHQGNGKNLFEEFDGISSNNGNSKYNLN